MDTPNDTPLKRCSKKESCVHPDAVDGWLPATLEYFYASKQSSDHFDWQCKNCRKISNDTSYHRYRKKRNAEWREWYQENCDQINERKRARRNEKPDLITLRRRARKKGLPDNFSVKEWQFALDYFDGCCAVCGRQLRDLFATHTAAMDHWIPLSSPDCPGTIATNIVPLCHGVNGCNNAKHSKNAETWLIERYGKRRAKIVLARVLAYFSTL